MATLDRIAALLAKAERSEHPAEAEAYLAKAQALATQASVDLAVARARTARRQAREQPMSRTITIGEVGKRANTHLVSLFVAIAAVNDVKVDVARNSTYVLAYGMPSDLDVVEAMFGSLATQMTGSAQAWLARGEWRGEHYVAVVRGAYGRHIRERRPHNAQTARAAFYRGFVDRIGARLAEARQAEERRQADLVVDLTADQLGTGPGDGVGPTGAGVGGAGTPRDGAPVTGALVLRAKDAEVRAFYRQASSARGSWSGYSGAVSRQAGSASVAGREAAARARLVTPKGLPAKGPGLPA